MSSLEKISSGPNFILYKSEDQKLIKIENVRFSYPHFGKKKVDENDDGGTKESWGGVAMLSKSTHVAAKEAFVALMQEIMTANDVKIPPEYRCIKNGDDKEDENMAGHWLITFNDSNRRPAVRDQKAGLMADEAAIDEKFYGGCWGSVLLRPWYFKGKAKNSTKTFPKRICCGFTGVQFLRDDKPFGNGRIDDNDAWGDESGGASAKGGSTDDDDGL